MIVTGQGQDAIAGFVYYAVIACWFLFAATFCLRKHPPKRQEIRRDRMATIGILIQAVAYCLVWFYPLQRKPFSPIVPMSKTAELALAGLSLAIAGVSLWTINAAVRRLGKQWAIAARLVEGHKLITDGPYRFVRNPIYTGMFGMLLATGLAVTRWSALLAAAVVFLAGTYIRVRVEERLLREQFGGKFDDYTRRVPAVVPGIW